MSNPLDQFRQPESPSTDTAEAIRMFFGVMLLLMGAAVCIVVLVTTYKVVYGPGELMLLQRLTPPDAVELEVASQNAKIVLPARIMSVVGYGMLVALLGMSTVIGVAMLRGGVALLRFLGMRQVIEKALREDMKEAALARRQ